MERTKNDAHNASIASDCLQRARRPDAYLAASHSRTSDRLHEKSIATSPELLYEVISDVVASWIDLAITAPISVAPAQDGAVDASPGGSGSEAGEELGGTNDDDDEWDEEEDGDDTDGDGDVDPSSHSELRRQLLERAASIDVDKSLPPNYVEPLLLVSHVVREVTLRILSEALDIPRYSDGRLVRSSSSASHVHLIDFARLGRNPWSCVKTGQRIRCLLLSPTISHMREPLLIVWEGHSLFAVYGSIAMLELTQLKFALHPSPSTLHVMSQAAVLAEEHTRSISRPTIPVIKLTFKGIRSFRQHFLPDVATLSVLPEHLAKALDLSTMTSLMRHELARLAAKVDLSLPSAESLFKYSRKGMYELSQIAYIWDSATFAPSDPPLT
ncbi:hypothetical protein EYR38_010444 [Pleurotus pulmonarius]|nr:hypothetical protein EYR38_010444 [Pleurotus pulmonarius]